MSMTAVFTMAQSQTRHYRATSGALSGKVCKTTNKQVGMRHKYPAHIRGKSRRQKSATSPVAIKRLMSAKCDSLFMFFACLFFICVCLLGCVCWRWGEGHC